MPVPLGLIPQDTQPPGLGGAATKATEREALAGSWVQWRKESSEGRSRQLEKSFLLESVSFWVVQVRQDAVAAKRARRRRKNREGGGDDDAIGEDEREREVGRNKVNLVMS